MTPTTRSTNWEVTIVLFVAFGNPILASLGMVFGDETVSGFTNLTGNYLIYMIIYELMILSGVAFFLKGRGWTLDDLNLVCNWRLTAVGLCLAVSSAFLTTIISYALKALGTTPPASVLHYKAGDWDLLPIMGISMVNPIFEETIVIGYVMGVFLKPNNPTKAINISVGLRMLYHLYQGIGGVITIVPMGLMFSYYYYKHRKLWPLIFAHGVMDFVALVSM
jgi:membrane protease YdiL (CAAX protease family)